MKRRTFLKVLGAFAVAPMAFWGSKKQAQDLTIKKYERKTFFVDYEKGVDFFNKGTNCKRPLKTISSAIDRVGENPGTIVLFPGR